MKVLIKHDKFWYFKRAKVIKFGISKGILSGKKDQYKKVLYFYIFLFIIHNISSYSDQYYTITGLP